MRPDPNLPPFFDPAQTPKHPSFFRPGLSLPPLFDSTQTSLLFSNRPKLPPLFVSWPEQTFPDFWSGLINQKFGKKKQQENQNKNKEVSFYWATLIRYRSCISCYKISDSFLLSNPRKLGHPLWGRFLLSPRVESWCSVGTDRSHDSFGISRDITMEMYGLLPRRDDVWVIHLPFPG